MSDTLPLEVKSRVDAHLDAVEKQLQAAGTNRSKRRGIVDDLETQILDMLTAGHAQAVALADVEEALARLDPPEAYVGEATSHANRPSTPQPVPRLRTSFSRDASRGAKWIGVAILGQAALLIQLMVADNMRSGRVFAPHAVPSRWLLVLFVVVAIAAAAAAIIGPIVGTVFGWIATRRIRSSDGVEHGLGISVIEALLYPMVLIWSLTGVTSEWALLALYRRDTFKLSDYEFFYAFRVCWGFWAVLLTLVLIGLLQRFTRSPRMARRSAPVPKRLVAAMR